MNETGDFECLRCASCCRSILESRSGIGRGLPLTEKEASLFPENTISPKLAIGPRRPDRVILHQLNMNVCPHVNSQNECSVYEERPLMCKSFPIVAGAISNRCRVFSYRRVGATYDEPYSMKSQLDASEKLEKYIQKQISKHSMGKSTLWEYDLATGKWSSIGEVDTK